MPNLKPYTGPTRLVLAFDIGTTFSGISYCFLEQGQAPEILGVTRFPGQSLVRGDAKVPSILYYDKSGHFKAAGAEAVDEGTIETALTEGWTKAEWWKLHLCPTQLASSIDKDVNLPPLPPGISVVHILTDFIKYLFRCAETYIRGHHLAFPWSSVEDSIQYIFTHPNGWEDVQWLYYRAIEYALLVPNTPEGQSRVQMLTEGEASLHFCVANLVNMETNDRTDPQGVVVIDAGGTTIDLSMFKMSFYPISCEEIAPAECRLQGSFYVTRRARVLLERKLEGWEHSSPEEIAEFTREFEQTTKLVIKSDQEPAYLRVAGRRTSCPKYNISFGKLKLTGKEATGLFNDSIDAIISAFEKQRKYTTIPITMAFLVGGLSTNDWLWYQLQSYFGDRKINIFRPDNHINKAVANGAVLSCLDPDHHQAHWQKAAHYKIKQVLWRTMKQNTDLEKTVESLRIQERDSSGRIAHLEKTLEELRAILRAHEQKHQCEVLYTQGCINDAAESLIELINAANEAVKTNGLIVDWIAEFTHRCVSRLETIGDEASSNGKYDEALAAYSTALSLSHATPDTVLIKWASTVLIRGSANEGLVVAARFKQSRFAIFRAICDVLQGNGRVMEAISCFRRMESERGGDTGSHNEQAQWEHSFRRRCTDSLKELTDTAMDSLNYNEAADHLSTILSLDPADRKDILIKRSKARGLMGSWEDALGDADEAIRLDPACHRGYEVKYVALHGARRHIEAAEAFDTMLKKLEESPDVNIREIRHRYVDARTTIQRFVHQTLRSMPRVLIDTTTGRLYDKQQQAEAFEMQPIYSEFVSSMTTQLDKPRIWRAVKEFYRYVMLSHRWEIGEPLLQNVENTSVYDLKTSQANAKLQRFCELVRSLGFRWAWTDNSCVDKSNNVVLQESLVAMFTWYRGSSLTIVYLRGVSSEFQQPGDLWQSIWNTRAWTYQEYVAADIILFYTEDWQPYPDLTVPNHKEFPDIISEMQQATGVAAQEMAVLRPGLDRVRQKLYLASRRETTLIEDIAYSLFGIFNVAIPVIYGEGNRAVGRFLEHILTGSGDVTILAWTGSASSYNSCLPTDLTVYNSLVPPHVPQPIDKAEMESMLSDLRSASIDRSLAKTLYHRLSELPPPLLAASRLRLPGIVFPLAHAPEIESGTQTDLRVYHATTPTFGKVEIKTADDLTGMEDLCLVHPWIRPLLDQEHWCGAATLDGATRALRLVARLRQPFGALLFEPLSRVEYRRVATDSLIMVRVREEVSLTELMDNIRTIEVQ